MLKGFLIGEIKQIFGISEEVVMKRIKPGLIVLGVYVLLILLTLGVSLGLDSIHFFTWSMIFSFILGIELYFLYGLLCLFIFSITIYYGAYFFRKGWSRFSQPHGAKEDV